MGNIILDEKFDYVGGVVGTGEKIIACYNTGTITALSTATGNGDSYIAGVVGCFADTPYMNSCYNIGSIKNNGTNNIKIGDILGDDPSENKGYDGKPTYVLGDNSGYAKFEETWPTSEGTWTADSNADGSYTYDESTQTFSNCKFWKSLGSWNNGVNPEYPKLWWEK